MKSFILALFLFVVAFTAVTDLFAQESPAVPPESEGHHWFNRFFKPQKAPLPKETNAETWQLFPAGTLPVRKAVSERDAVNLAAGDYSTESLYLVGSFVVTASGRNKAILRPTPNGAACRVIVNYPRELLSPAEGSKLVRDESRAFQIRAVRLAGNTVNLFVREVTLP